MNFRVSGIFRSFRYVFTKFDVRAELPMTDTTYLIDKITAANAMTDDQLLDLRRAFGADMAIDGREADALFELDKIAKKPEGWADYFVLILTTYLVHQGRPEGYINDAMAAWLICLLYTSPSPRDRG